jgi:hypothetical protein
MKVTLANSKTLRSLLSLLLERSAWQGAADFFPEMSLITK